MQTEIFQVVALVTHGNAALAGWPVAGFHRGHAAFTFSEFVRFADMEPSPAAWNERPFAVDPDDWLAKLKGGGCAGLRVVGPSTDTGSTADPFSGAFGGQWLIEAVNPAGSDLWFPKWSIGDSQHPEQKIWQVTYGRVAIGEERKGVEPVPLTPLAANLRQALGEAVAFSRRLSLPFTRAFKAALADLDSESEPELHGLAPPGQLPLPAARLLSASLSAWVFGGMGSWNDLGFEGADGEEYDRISERLYLLVNAGVVEAANCSFATPAHG